MTDDAKPYTPTLAVRHLIRAEKAEAALARAEAAIDQALAIWNDPETEEGPHAVAHRAFTALSDHRQENPRG